MELDVIYVTYNSQKWIKRCFESLAQSEYPKNKLNIFIVDNASKDETLDELNHIKNDIGQQFSTFEIIKSVENLGFGKANNLGFSKGNCDVACFFNIDTEVFPNTISNLVKEIEISNEEVALWELRQFPYEHPKFYNILTGYTTWSSGAAFAMKRTLYTELNGFDEKIFMYAEDVDLSWRISAKGYKLKYCPKATISHYSYEGANEVKPNQYLNSIINNLLLRYRFGYFKTIVKGNSMLLGLMRRKGPFEHSRKMLLKRYLKHFLSIPHFISWKFKNKDIRTKFQPKFLGWDYEIIREGAFYKNEYSKTNPLVSIIVRTCNRPSVLRETLISLRNQTYANIEIVIVEDGRNTAEKIINEEFSDLNVQYFATNKNVGRSKAGNKAMELAKGKYLNFLDDDDLFYADHVEVLVKTLEENRQRAAYSLAYETPIIIESIEPYAYKEIFHNLIYKQPFNKLLLFHHNYIPIQCIMFDKDLFLENGGLDESLDALEDWDLWVRYALRDDFIFVNKVTSLYRVPFNRESSKERQQSLDDALHIVRKKHESYKAINVPTKVASELDEILNTYSIKISAEVMARLEARIPMAPKVINKIKQIVKGKLK